jgi:Wiskott-Aldrich syndrome protein
MIAAARLYHTPFGAANDDWTYSQLKGLLVFGRDRSPAGNSAAANTAHDSRVWFRLVDAATGRTVWMFKVTPGLDYQQEKPFFHTFPGKVRVPRRVLSAERIQLANV